MKKESKYFKIKVFDKGKALQESQIIYIENTNKYKNIMNGIAKKYGLPKDEIEAFTDEEFSREVLNDARSEYQFVTTVIEIHIEQATKFNKMVDDLYDL
jgi:soluble P-type ATPase